MEKKIRKCKICGIRPVVEDDREDEVNFEYCKECFEDGSVDKFEALNRESHEKNTPLTEIEDLRELIEREGASVGILLLAASGDSAIETDEVCLFMRDCCDRMEKAKELLDRIEKIATEGEDHGKRENNQCLC
jgi:hypothetical protein